METIGSSRLGKVDLKLFQKAMTASHNSIDDWGWGWGRGETQMAREMWYT